MFNNVAFDVVIGLAFIFLLYSLLATILQELLASIVGLRGYMLNKAIRTMLEDRLSFGDRLPDKYKNNKNIKAFLSWRLISIIWSLMENLFYFFFPLPRPSLAKAFYKHPTIKYLSTGGFTNKPSYIGPSVFSTTMIRLLRGEGYTGEVAEIDVIKKNLLAAKPQITTGQIVCDIDDETLKQLRLIFYESKNDIDRFRLLLETWFNETMDRCKGWYKKQTQIILLIIGLIIAASFNVDAIWIGQRLSKDKTAREALVQMAINAPDRFKSAVGAPPDSIWRNDKIKEVYKNVKDDIDGANSILGQGAVGRTSLNRYIGWLITALAISLGAPFWFDLLNKLVMLRGSKSKEGSTQNVKKNTQVPANDRVG